MKSPYGIDGQVEHFEKVFFKALLPYRPMIQKKLNEGIEISLETFPQLSIFINFSNDIRDMHTDGYYISVMKDGEVIGGTTRTVIQGNGLLENWLKTSLGNDN